MTPTTARTSTKRYSKNRLGYYTIPSNAYLSLYCRKPNKIRAILCTAQITCFVKQWCLSRVRKGERGSSCYLFSLASPRDRYVSIFLSLWLDLRLTVAGLPLPIPQFEQLFMVSYMIFIITNNVQNDNVTEFALLDCRSRVFSCIKVMFRTSFFRNFLCNL